MNLIKETVLKNVSNYPVKRVFEGRENAFSQAIVCEGKKKWQSLDGYCFGRQDRHVYLEKYTITQPTPTQTEYNVGFTLMDTISVPADWMTLRDHIFSLGGCTYRRNRRNCNSPDFVGINFTQREDSNGTSLQIGFCDKQGQSRLIWEAPDASTDVKTPFLEKVFDNWNARYINPWIFSFGKEGTFLETWSSKATINLQSSDLEPIDRAFIRAVFHNAPLPTPTAPISTTWYDACKKGWATSCRQEASEGQRRFQDFLRKIQSRER